jgi:hypothetical protein
VLCSLNKISEQLPEIEHAIKQNRKVYADIRKELGKTVNCETEDDASDFLNEFADDFCMTLKNLFEDNSDTLIEDYLVGGSKIRSIFKNFSQEKILKIDPMKKLNPDHVYLEIKRVWGMYPNLMIPEKTLRNLIKKCIEMFRKPIKGCWNSVNKAILDSADHILSIKIGTRPKLKHIFSETVKKVTLEWSKELDFFLEKLIQCEKDFINYEHLDFKKMRSYVLSEEANDQLFYNEMIKKKDIDSSLFNIHGNFSVDKKIKERKENPKYSDNSSDEEEEKICSPPKKKHKEKKVRHDIVSVLDEIDSDDKKLIHILYKAVNCYISIIKKDLSANVPKYIASILILGSTSKIRKEIMRALRTERDFIALASETPEIMIKRQEAEDNYQKLNDCLRAIKIYRRCH